MNNLKLGIVFDVKNGKFKSDVKQSGQVIKQFGNNTDHTAIQARNMGNALATANAKLVTTNKVAQAVTRSIGTMGAGFGASMLLKELSDTTKKFQVLRATLETATGSENKAADAFERLQIFAAKTPFSVEESIQAFIKLKNLGLDPTEAALNSYGNTASAMGKSLDQFIEAVADASVSEFERLKEFGIKAKNQGDKIAFTFRKNTVEVANNAAEIEKYLQNLGNNEFAGAMDRIAATYAGSLSNMGDAWDQFLLKISDDGAGNIMQGSIKDITTSLQYLTEHTEEISTLFSVGFVLAAGHATNAIYAKTAATAKSIVADIAKAKAAMTAAKADEILAVSANHRAIQEQAAAKRSLANATNTYARTRAVKNLAIANGQVTASERVLITSRKALTVATRSASIATRALSGSMALLGGPVGVAMLAAYAVYSFAMSAADGARESTNLAAGVDLASKKLSELSTKQLKLRLFDLEDDPQTQIDTARLSALKAQQEYNKVQAARGFKNPNKEGVKVDLSRDVEIEALEAKAQRIDKLKAQIQVLLAKPDLPENNPVTDAPLDKKLATELARIEQSLLSKEEAIKASYIRRQQIVDTALLGKKGQEQKYNNLSLGLELQKEAKLKALAEQKAAQEKQRADAKIQAELNAREQVDQLRRDGYAAEIAELNGFHLMKMELKAGQTEEELQQIRNRNLMLLQEERDHQDAKRNLQNKHTGIYGQLLNQQVEFQRATGKDKLLIGASTIQGMASQMSGQSKTAFKIAKAAALAQAAIALPSAVLQSFQNGGGFPWGLIPAGLMLAKGAMQISKIKSQQPPGFEHGGNIGNNNIIEFGERNNPEVLEFEGKNFLLGGNQGAVFNKTQLNEINGVGGGGSNIVHLNFAPNIHVRSKEEIIDEVRLAADAVVEIIDEYNNDRMVS
ncbi:MAG: hypothetical protein JKY26_01655 [Pseudomonas sp.]|nr:hypothetical protein [Pseudomonas sp.]